MQRCGFVWNVFYSIESIVHIPSQLQPLKICRTRQLLMHFWHLPQDFAKNGTAVDEFEDFVFV